MQLPHRCPRTTRTARDISVLNVLARISKISKKNGRAASLSLCKHRERVTSCVASLNELKHVKHFSRGDRPKFAFTKVLSPGQTGHLQNARHPDC